MRHCSRLHTTHTVILPLNHELAIHDHGFTLHHLIHDTSSRPVQFQAYSKAVHHFNQVLASPQRSQNETRIYMSKGLSSNILEDQCPAEPQLLTTCQIQIRKVRVNGHAHPSNINSLLALPDHTFRCTCTVVT